MTPFQRRRKRPKKLPVVLSDQEASRLIERRVPASPRLLDALRDYWKIRRPNNYLFPGRTPDVPLSSATIQKACRLSAALAGIKNIVTPHTLRHSYATSMLEAGVDLLTISKLLGHSSFITTMIYLHVRRQHFERSPSPIDWLPVRQCPQWAERIPESNTTNLPADSLAPQTDANTLPTDTQPAAAAEASQPHIHALVPGAGPSANPDNDPCWVVAQDASFPNRREPFLVDIEQLGRTFRDRFVRGLGTLLRKGSLRLQDEWSQLHDTRVRRAWLKALRQSNWNVFISGPPSGSSDPEQVLKYMTRYLTGGPTGAESSPPCPRCQKPMVLLECLPRPSWRDIFQGSATHPALVDFRWLRPDPQTRPHPFEPDG